MQRPSVAAHHPGRLPLGFDRHGDVGDLALDQSAVERHLLPGHERGAVGAVEVEVVGPVGRVQTRVHRHAVEGSGGVVEQGQMAVTVAGDDAHVDGRQDDFEEGASALGSSPGAGGLGVARLQR